MEEVKIPMKNTDDHEEVEEALTTVQSNARVVAESLASEDCIGYVAVVASKNGEDGFSVHGGAGAAGKVSVTVALLEVLAELGSELASNLNKAMEEEEDKDEPA